MADEFQFAVPAGVQPGSKVRVNTPDGRQVDVILPANAKPGLLIRVKVPTEIIGQSDPTPEAVPDSLLSVGNLPPLKVVIPQNLGPDRRIAVLGPDGRQVIITIPQGFFPGQEIVVDMNTKQVLNTNVSAPAQQMEVIIPPGINPGQLLAVRAPSGRIVQTTVPSNANPGDKLIIDMQTGSLIRLIETVPSALPVNDSELKLEPPAVGGGFQQPQQIPMQLPMFPSWFQFHGYPVQAIPISSNPVNLSPPPMPTGRKKALLIGINYPGTRAELRGCINDVVMMREFLGQQGFQSTPQTMVCLVDNSNDPNFLPTRANIIRGIQWLLAGAAPGDTLFFHYSGHGAQEPDNSGREADGLNETLCPSDFNKPNSGGGMISDDTLWDLLCGPLPAGCRLYALLDCCHSGTGLDLSYSYSGNRWVTAPNPNFSMGDVIMFSGCRDNQTSADAWSHDMKAPGGAMTTSFVNCFKRNPQAPFSSFIDSLLRDIRGRGFTQIPQLSASQQWNPNQRFLDFHHGIIGNQNPQWGKIKNQHFKPETPNMGGSPLGPMLAAAGFAVLFAPELLSAGGGIVERLGEGLGGLDLGIGGGGFDLDIGGGGLLDSFFD